MNIKTHLLTCTATLLAASLASAAAGYFGNTYVVAGGGTFYQADGTPDGVNPALSGGFGNLSQGGTFNIQGFELNTFEDNGTEISTVSMFWTVDSFANVHEIQITPAPALSGNDRFWQITTATQNLLDNNGVGTLALGGHTFEAYFQAVTNGTDSDVNVFLNNGGSNYTSSFNVVPEPGTYALLAGFLALAAIALRRRGL